MPETFLILLAGGIMLAAAISDPKQVTLLWLRLAGIIALSLACLSLLFLVRRDGPRVPRQWILCSAAMACILGQLAFVQVAWRGTQRLFALLAYLAAITTGVLVIPRLTPQNEAHIAIPLAGISAMTGLVLMDMLLGHAYLTAGDMSMKPFARLNAALAIVTLLRLLCSPIGVYVLTALHPVRMLWDIHGLLMLTRWLVGLALPIVFIYMAHDCIRRRATQSATGILYVCGILIFIGEMI